MKKTLLILLAVVMLTGCSVPYYKEGMTKKDTARDMKECWDTVKTKGEKVVQFIPVVAEVVSITNSSFWRMKADECMKEKGYIYIP